MRRWPGGPSRAARSWRRGRGRAMRRWRRARRTRGSQRRWHPSSSPWRRPPSGSGRSWMRRTGRPPRSGRARRGGGRRVSGWRRSSRRTWRRPRARAVRSFPPRVARWWLSSIALSIHLPCESILTLLCRGVFRLTHLVVARQQLACQQVCTAHQWTIHASLAVPQPPRPRARTHSWSCRAAEPRAARRRSCGPGAAEQPRQTQPAQPRGGGHRRARGAVRGGAVRNFSSRIHTCFTAVAA